MTILRTVRRTSICIVLLLGTSTWFKGAFAQNCQPSNTAVTNCSPTGQNCGQPVESNANGLVYAWPQGTIVQVNINTTGLQTSQVQAISQAFSDWNGVGNVSFTVSTSTGTPLASTPLT